MALGCASKQKQNRVGSSNKPARQDLPVSIDLWVPMADVEDNSNRQIAQGTCLHWGCIR
jgi:hypothetical protein